jgi:cellulose synthase/poly-beta-1,6-N-acetylglucosamine synthase-like glycosyltransferase
MLHVEERASASAPFVTVAMPCLDEERFIDACVRSVLAQDYPRERLEVLVADGGSTDATREILARLAAEDARIRVIDNPERIQAAGMNAMVRAARGEVIVRMDVHCEYASDYVRRCVEALERTGADNVGGAQRTRATTRFQRALAAALSSPLGVGGAKYRTTDSEGFVDTVFLGAFPRRVFERIGMYDRHAVTNEDAELNQRIVLAGGRVYLSRDIVVHYHPRASFRALAKQYFAYGKGRARTLLKHRKLATVRPVVPFLVVTGASALLATSHLQPLTPLLLGAYAIATGAEAVRVGVDAGLLASIPLVWAMFPVLHVSHGVGFGVGLAYYGLVQRDWTAPPEHLVSITAAQRSS